MFGVESQAVASVGHIDEWHLLSAEPLEHPTLDLGPRLAEEGVVLRPPLPQPGLEPVGPVVERIGDRVHEPDQKTTGSVGGWYARMSWPRPFRVGWSCGNAILPDGTALVYSPTDNSLRRPISSWKVQSVSSDRQRTLSIITHL